MKTDAITLTPALLSLLNTLECKWVVAHIVSAMIADTEVRYQPIVFWTLATVPHNDNGYTWQLRATDGDKGDGEIELACGKIQYADLSPKHAPLRIWVCMQRQDDDAPRWVFMLPEDY
jgi:hypothetical protein